MIRPESIWIIRSNRFLAIQYFMPSITGEGQLIASDENMDFKYNRKIRVQGL